MRLATLSLLVVAACTRGPPPGEGMVALTGGTVLDVVSGRTVPDAVVLIRDGHIVSVGMREVLPVPRGAQEESLAGRWIIPGLIDAHAHLQPWGLTASLRWGVTTVRDLHGGLPAVAESPDPSPRRFVAIAMLDGTPTTYPDAVPVTDTSRIGPALDSLRAIGATWVKVYTHITPELLESVLFAARARRLPVAAHLGLTDAVIAARLGVASIEHLSGVPEASGDSPALTAAHRDGFFAGWTAFERAWIWADTAALGRVADELAASGVTLVPTLGLHEIFARLDDSAVHRRADLADVPDSARTNWNVAGMIARAGWGAGDFADFRAARPRQDWFVHRFVSRGGRVATGTDASNQLLVPGAGVHLEMELLVGAGLAPLDALRAATLRGAELLGADSLGRLRPGSVADLVVLGSDPLVDIRATRRIERVMLGGEWIPR